MVNQKYALSLFGLIPICLSIVIYNDGQHLFGFICVCLLAVLTLFFMYVMEKTLIKSFALNKQICDLNLQLITDIERITKNVSRTKR